MMKKLVFMLFCILMFPAVLSAFEITADVDRREIEPGESVMLSLTVRGGEPEMDLSVVRDFRVVPRGTSSSLQIINGEVSREKTFNYLLVPLKDGVLTIPALEVEFKGRTYSTGEISITVAEGAPREARNGLPPLSVAAALSERNPYEGEQVVYTFTLQSRAQYANARFQKPRFSGFTVKEIGQKEPYRTRVKGQEVTMTELRYLLIPLKSGTITIEPALLECDVATGKRSRRTSPFDSLFPESFLGRSTFQHRVFRTDPLTVHVKPLPRDTARPDFSGLVGSFTMKTMLERDTVNVGDSTTLTVTIEGRGNVMDAGEPTVEIPDAFKLYTDVPQEEITLSEDGIKGSKTFRFALVATREGSYAIAPFRMSYFDPTTETCRVLASEPLSVTVGKAAEEDASAVFESPPGDEGTRGPRKSVEFTGRDILPLKEDLDALEHRRSLRHYQFAFLLILPCLLYGIVKILLAVRRKNADAGSRMVRRAHGALKMAERRVGRDEEFFSCLRRALLSIILSHAGLQGEVLTYDETEAILLGGGYPAETAKNAAELMKNIESARYGGRVVDETLKKKLLDDTQRMVRSLTR